MTLEHTILKRLAFVKYLFTLAVEQSKAPEILAAASLLTFHDAIELFLQISSEYLNAKADQPNFMEYWNLISKKTTKELPQKEAMRRLNKARVALKHNGIMSSKTDIESFRVTTEQFFIDASKLIYEIEFQDISLIEYVTPEESREHLKKAEQFLAQDSYSEATQEIALSFEKMISAYESDKEMEFQSPFFFGKDMTFLSSSHLGIDRSDFGEFADFVDNVKESIEAMQKSIKILALGLDYKKYSKFMMHLPYVAKMLSGDYRVFEGIHKKESTADKEYIEFCIHFVIECSVKLNEFNYSVEEKNLI